MVLYNIYREKSSLFLKKIEKIKIFKNFKIFSKKVLTKFEMCGKLYKLSSETGSGKPRTSVLEKEIKKVQKKA